MKKTPERKHVSINTQRQVRDGKETVTHIVCWTPEKGNRKRRGFSDLAEAEQEADRIEELMRKGFDGIAEVSRQDLAALVRFREQFGNVSLPEVLQVYAEHSGGGFVGTGNRILVAKAVKDFMESRETDDFSPRHQQTVRSHMKSFLARFGDVELKDLNRRPEDLEKYLKTGVGGAPKTRLQHLITIRSFFRRARDKKKLLPYNQPTAADLIDTPKVVNGEHKVYTPAQFMRLLVFTPQDAVMFMVLGQLGGFRASERLRLHWSHWRSDEDNKIVANRDVTKTSRRRRVDVEPALAEWLSLFKTESAEFISPRRSQPLCGAIAKTAGLTWNNNALRSGYCSYHMELHDNAALTSKNSGHTITELETDYKSIEGVTKKAAQEMFAITPKAVLKFAREHNLSKPAWAHLVK